VVKDEAVAAEDGSEYAFRPSLLGAPRQFRLTDDAIEWVHGTRGGRVPFRDIRRVRLSYRPASMQSQRYLTEVWSERAPKLEIVSSSWKSMVEQQRLDRDYSTFVAEMHRRLARAGGDGIVFQSGSNPVLYWPGVAIFAAVAAALTLMFARALIDGAYVAALVVGGFFGLFIWQSGNFFRRNRPGRYRPDAPPAVLLPGLEAPRIVS